MKLLAQNRITYTNQKQEPVQYMCLHAWLLSGYKYTATTPLHYTNQT